VEFGFSNIVVCDRKGAIHTGRDLGDNTTKIWIAENTNPNAEDGSVKDVGHRTLAIAASHLPASEDRDGGESVTGGLRTAAAQSSRLAR